MKDLWDRSGVPGRRKSEGVPLRRPPVPSCHLFPLDASLLVRASPPATPSDASCSADQRDFCLKHDLSLKYLKPDYLWVCHLGRTSPRTVAGSSTPPFLPFFSPRATRLCRWNPTPLNSLYERETFSLALSASPCSTPFCPLSSMKGIPGLPLECNEIWHIPFITADILLSFGHTFQTARSRVRGSPVLSLSFSFSLVYSSCHGVFTKVVSIVIATTIWILERHKARGQSVNRYNISLDMQMSVAQLRTTTRFDMYHRNESCLNMYILNIDITL